MDKLQTINRQRDAVQQRLDERLPRQHRQLAVWVTATKWRLATLRRHKPHAYTQELLDATTKKLRMEVGAFEYVAKEQNELLTRALFQLDDVLSHGDAAIKDARKALVLSVQQLLERADQMNAKAAALKQFTERMIGRLPAVPETVDDQPMDTDSESAVEQSFESTMMKQVDDDWEHVEVDDLRPLVASDTEEDPTQQEEPKKDSAVHEDTVMDQPEEVVNEDAQLMEQQDDEDDEDDESDEDGADENDEPVAEDMQEESTSDDTDSLPVWRPYYQIQKRPDGAYIVANLHRVDPRHVQVQAMPQHSVLRIVGVKYPTQKDVLLSQLRGAPTFGRFEIAERFPTQMLNLENASQQLRPDGTLQVRVPYYVLHHPRVLRRVSPFQPRRLSVW